MIRKLAIVFVVCLIALFFISDSTISKLAKNGIETYAPDIIGANVTVGYIGLSPLSGSLTIKDMVVGNPKGFVSKHAVTLHRIDIEADIASFFSDTILIKKLHIGGPSVFIETKGGTTNLQALQQNAARSSNQKPGATSTTNTPSATSSSSKKVIIEDLRINNAKVTPSIGDTKIALPLPDIHLRHLGKESKGITFAQAANQILAATTRSLQKVDLSKLLNVKIDLKNTDLKSLTNQFKQEKGALKDSLKGLLR